MSKKRCCRNQIADQGCCGGSAASLCTNPICAIILLIILQRTCLLENKNAFLLILLFLGFCFCKGGYGRNVERKCGC